MILNIDTFTAFLGKPFKNILTGSLGKPLGNMLTLSPGKSIGDMLTLVGDLSGYCEVVKGGYELSAAPNLAP